MRTYEAIVILDERKVEKDGTAFAEQLQTNIESRGGSVKDKTSLGKKQFPRSMGKHTAGLFWKIVFDLDPSQINDFRESYKLDAAVLRLGIVLYDPKEANQEQTQIASPSAEEEPAVSA